MQIRPWHHVTLRVPDVHVEDFCAWAQWRKTKQIRLSCLLITHIIVVFSLFKPNYDLFCFVFQIELNIWMSRLYVDHDPSTAVSCLLLDETFKYIFLPLLLSEHKPFIWLCGKGKDNWWCLTKFKWRFSDMTCLCVYCGLCKLKTWKKWLGESKDTKKYPILYL